MKKRRRVSELDPCGECDSTNPLSGVGIGQGIFERKSQEIFSFSFSFFFFLEEKGIFF